MMTINTIDTISITIPLSLFNSAPSVLTSMSHVGNMLWKLSGTVKAEFKNEKKAPTAKGVANVKNTADIKWAV